MQLSPFTPRSNLSELTAVQLSTRAALPSPPWVTHARSSSLRVQSPTRQAVYPAPARPLMATGYAVPMPLGYGGAPQLPVTATAAALPYPAAAPLVPGLAPAAFVAPQYTPIQPTVGAVYPMRSPR